MPTYSFVCRDCGRTYEIKCAISERDSARCPACGSSNKRQDYRGFAQVGRNSAAGGRALPAASCG